MLALVRSLPPLARRNYWLIFWEACTTVGHITVVASFIPVFALELHMTPNQLGWLMALPFLANALVLLVVGPYLSGPRLKPLMVISGLLHRALLAALPLALWLGPAGPAWTMLCYGLGSGCLAVSATTWSALVSRLLPVHGRGQLLGWRNMAFMLTSVALSAAGGLLLDRWPAPWNYVAVFGGASLFGFAGAYLLACLDEGPVDPAGPGVGLQWREAWRTPGFAWVVLSYALFNLGFQGAPPVANLLWVDELGYSKALIGLLSGAVNLASAVGFLWWGRLCDRWGNARVCAWTMALLGLQALAFPWQRSVGWFLLMQAWGGFATAGVMISSFNLTLTLGVAETRARLIAFLNVLNNTAMVAAPRLAVALYDLGGVRAAFLVGALLRASGALFLLPLLERPRPAPDLPVPATPPRTPAEPPAPATPAPPVAPPRPSPVGDGSGRAG